MISATVFWVEGYLIAELVQSTPKADPTLGEKVQGLESLEKVHKDA